MKKIFIKKRTIVSIVLSCLIIVILVNYFNPELKLTDNILALEYGEKVPDDMSSLIDLSIYENKDVLKDIIISSENIKNHNEKIEVGEYNVDYKYRNTKKTLKIIVKDTKPPKISVPQEINILETGRFYYSNFVSIAEESKYDVISDDSKVNYSVPGVYSVSVSAIDMYGNSASMEIPINIKKLELSISSNSMRLEKNEQEKMEVITNSSFPVKYESSDQNVATVDKYGYIFAKSKGTAIISAYIDSKRVECTVVVSTPREESISPKISSVVYKTKTGKKYHRGDCQYLWNSSYSISKSAAIAEGLSACSRCNP